MSSLVVFRASTIIPIVSAATPSNIIPTCQRILQGMIPLTQYESIAVP